MPHFFLNKLAAFALTRGGSWWPIHFLLVLVLLILVICQAPLDAVFDQVEVAFAITGRIVVLSWLRLTILLLMFDFVVSAIKIVQVVVDFLHQQDIIIGFIGQPWTFKHESALGFESTMCAT